MKRVVFRMKITRFACILCDQKKDRGFFKKGVDPSSEFSIMRPTSTGKAKQPET